MLRPLPRGIVEKTFDTKKFNGVTRASICCEICQNFSYDTSEFVTVSAETSCNGYPIVFRMFSKDEVLIWRVGV